VSESDRPGIRLGIVGCGAAARRCHIPALVGASPFTLTVLVDRDAAHAAETARLFGVLRAEAGRTGLDPRIETDLRAAMEAADAFVVATSHESHARIAEELLRAGKHVLVEKPLALRVSEAERIADAARAGSAVAVPAHVRRFFPAAHWVRAMLAEHAVGAVRSVRWSEGRHYDWPVTSDFMFSADAGGGLLADSGPHVFDLLCWWFGEPVRLVDYEHNADDGGSESELGATIAFHEVTARVELRRLRELSNRCVIEGEKGTLSVGTGFPGEFEHRDRDGTVVAAGAVPVRVPATDSWVGLFAGQFEDFAGAIIGEHAPFADLSDGTRTVRLLEACADGTNRRPLARPWACRPARTDEGASGRVAVTGATGFIGGHLAEGLVAAGRETVAVARDLSRLSRLSHLDQRLLRFAHADIRDRDRLATAFEGCDVVVHTVYGSGGTPEEQWSVSVEGTRTVIEAARLAGVRRLVQLSTVAVYDGAGRTVLDEDSPPPPEVSGDLGYARQKIEADRLALGASAPLEVVCLQPTVVYGPLAPSWTVNPLRRLAAGASLPTGEANEGVCNPVHVADVVGAILHVAGDVPVAGRRLLVSGPETVSWGRFYDRYRAMLGLAPPGGPTGEGLDDWERALYADRAVVRTEALARAGFRPSVGFAEGMGHVEDWARWAGLVA
jgi:predicted dehydrogenase/nucleoside-diphosphate-sugar epimerase